MVLAGEGMGCELSSTGRYMPSDVIPNRSSAATGPVFRPGFRAWELKGVGKFERGI